MIRISGIKKIMDTCCSLSVSSKTDTRNTSHTSRPEQYPPCEQSRILVFSKQPFFSETMMDYAPDMASKSHAEIIAMNLDEQKRDFEDFQKQAKNSVSTFLHRAQKAGVFFSHMVCGGPEERVVDHLYTATDGFTYIMGNVSAMLGASHAIHVYVHTR